VTFDEVLVKVEELLRQQQRVSYRGLKRRFSLDDEYLKDLKEELIDAKRVATDEEGRFLVWSGESATIPAPSAMPARTPEAERRQLTVEFIDLVGSTSLSQQLDPEDLRLVMQAYRETCAAVIRRFEGYLAKYIGDGLLVYFGYPHEDDAQRAVQAGLGILAELPQLNARFRSTIVAHVSAPLQLRIGIHTGLVVAGEMGVDDQPEPLGIVGETPNIAARL
jgi:class 3 adenylate cyclase